MNKGVATAITGRLFQTLVKLAAIIWLSRSLSVAHFGALTFAIAFAFILALLVDFGAATTLSRSMASAGNASVRLYVKRALLQLAAFSSLYLLLSFLLRGRLAAAFDSPLLQTHWYLVWALVAAISIDDWGNKFFQGLKNFKVFAQVQVQTSWIPWAAALVTVFFKTDAVSALTAYTLGYLPSACLTLWRIRQYMPEPGTAPTDHVTQGQFLKTSTPYFLSGLSMQVFLRSDILLLQYFTSSEVVGIYAIAARMADTSQVVAIAISNSVASHFVDFYKEAGTYARQLKQWTLNVSVPYLLLALALLFGAAYIVPLVFGSKYTEAVPIVYLFTPFIVARAMSSLYSPVLDYLGYVRTRARLVGAAAAANVLLNCLLIPQMGAYGAITSTLIVYLPLVAYYSILLHRLKPVVINEYRQALLLLVASTVAAALVSYSLSGLWGFVALVLVLLVGFALGIQRKLIRR